MIVAVPERAPVTQPGTVPGASTGIAVDQAIFTSLVRHDRSGYHLVARSSGVSEAEAQALATWSPSQDALIVDAHNRTSVNFWPLPGGRFALSRTCLGPPEYSGRGGNQVYTHALIIPRDLLGLCEGHPLPIYLAALAQGLLFHQVDPPRRLERVPVGSLYPAWSDTGEGPAFAAPTPLRDRLDHGLTVVFPHAGDRLALVGRLLTSLPPDQRPTLSFTTSLRPSSVRAVRLALIAPSETDPH